MTGRELIRWSSLHERRARSGRWWSHPAVAAIAAGAALAAWVWWRGSTDTPPKGDGSFLGMFSAPSVAAAHGWIAGAVAMFAFAFLRVPFHVYWRPDASLLAQLPIDGSALFAAAMRRCLRAAIATTVAALIGGIPLVFIRGDDTTPVAIVLPFVSIAIVLGICAGLLMPAVVIWSAALVSLDEGARATSMIRTATQIVGGAPAGKQMAAVALAQPSSAVLGAVPGFAGAVIVVAILGASTWLSTRVPERTTTGLLVGLSAAGVLAILAIRPRAARAMASILRDVSALDRQRLAHLEIRPPTAIEKLLAKLAGHGALVYAKDARLMRRRYPLAYALGAVVFLVLAIVAAVRPVDATPWLAAPLVAATVYAAVLVKRLREPPIELPRLADTLPITASARQRAKLVWLAGWYIIFVAIPG
ncbi:MAG TPA: hypothetical protein VGO00_18955, partial [Kofleriaceae bacterium]|nr:hypothetical protein [Kofleriaceae bacterium]